MKSVLSFLILTLVLFLTGCSGVKLSPSQLSSMATSENIAKQSCYQWIETVAQKEAENVSSMNPDQAYNYLMAKSYQQSTEKVVSMFTGKSADPCGGGMNVWGYLATVVQEQNETLRTGISTGAQILTVGVVTWGATEVADSMFSAVNKGTGGVNVTGDGNTIADTANKTTTTTNGSSIANVNNRTPAPTPTDGVTDSVYSVFDQCSEGLSYTNTLGEVGSCMSARGLDVEITGGLLYLDGEEYNPVNSWEAERP